MNKLVLSLLLLFVSASSFGFDAREVYEQKFASQPTGVYEDSGYLFFVVKQQCLTEKKYSGTKESKEAELQFYSLLVNEANSRSVSFDPGSILFSGQLRQDIFNSISKKYDAKNLISHQLLFDRDRSNCIREYVQSARADLFEKNKIKIPQADINKIKRDLIVTALDDENNALLSSYLKSLKLTQLAMIYKEIEKDSVYPFGIKFNDNISKYEAFCANNQYCKSDIKINSKYDFDGVLAKVINAKGIINVTSLTRNKAMSDDFFLKAKLNFDKGQNPQQIIADLTLSINASPNNVEAWKMLSNIYRAVKENQLAQYSSNQYTIQNPTSAEAWVYVMKAMSAIDKNEADALHSLLVLISSHVEFSAWAQKQIKEYR